MTGSKAETTPVILVFREPVSWKAVSALTYTPRNSCYSLGNKNILVFFTAPPKPKRKTTNTTTNTQAQNLPLNTLVKNPCYSFTLNEENTEDLCSRLALDHALMLAEDIAWDEREEKKGKKARWGKGKNSHMLLYYRIYEKTITSFREQYDTTRELLSQVDIIIEKDPRGRKPLYDREKTLAALIAGSEKSLRGIAETVRDLNLDMTAKGKTWNGKPCYGTYHYHLKKVGEETLNEVLSLIYRVGARIYEEVTGEKPRVFAVDGSARTKAHTEETTVAGRSTLTHKPQPYQVAANTETNLTIGVDALSKQNDATKLLGRTPQGSTTPLDRAYYTKDNIKACEERKHHYQIRPKKWRGKDYKGAVFRRCRETFDQNEYRWRKLVERIFANMETRAGKTSYYEDQEVHDKGLKLEAIHHNIQRVSFLLGMRHFFIPLGKPPPEEVALPEFVRQTICEKTWLVHPT